MDIKPRPNQKYYLKILRSMSPERKLQTVFELQDMAKELCLQGLRQNHPDLAETEIKRLYLERIKRCHNRNY